MQARDTLFGRYRVLEPAENLSIIHVRDTSKKLKVSDFEPKVAVLDQEDFAKQGIDVTRFIPGAKKVDALGSCTANTSEEALSLVLTEAEFEAHVNAMGAQTVSAAVGDLYQNTVGVERAAIGFYHGCTDQTGQKSQEWPPTDCGSSGQYCVEFMLKLGLPIKQAVASGADSVVSLMQTHALMLGTTWLNDWMDPVGPDYFIDGNGKLATVASQIQRGVAGGHEITMSAIEKLTIHASTGLVDPFNTIIRIRNHWDSSWADHGSARVHLSTLTSGPLAKYADMRAVQRA